MDSLQRILDQHGSTILSVLLVAVGVIVIFAILDGNKRDRPQSKRGGERRDD